MASRMKSKVEPGEALGLKLLQSVREMKAGKAARVTHVELTEAGEARQTVSRPGLQVGVMSSDAIRYRHRY